MAGNAPRALTWAAVVTVFMLMTIGNIVSATGSGLACPDWPLCHGRLIPPVEPAVLIEYSHRLMAVLASLLLAATIIATIRRGSAAPVRRAGLVLLGLLALQIALGGVTVLLRLPHLISTAHLVNALLILGGLLSLAARTQSKWGGASAPPTGSARADFLTGSQSNGAPAASESGKIARLARVGVLVLLLQLALGGYVRHAGAGLACPDFPLCSGALLPEHWLATAHWVHRWLGVILLGLFVHLAMAARGTRFGGGAVITAALACLQVALGIATVLLRLDPPIRAIHATAGYALWVALVWVSARAGSWHAILGEPPSVREAAAEVPHVA